MKEIVIKGKAFTESEVCDYGKKSIAKTRKILMESQESFIPHTPYAYERNLLEAVREGDLDKAKACDYLLGTTGKSGTLSENPLRQEQIMFIAFITQITRAAIDGGVSENLAFAMSDSYIQTSEKCVDIKPLVAK